MAKVSAFIKDSKAHEKEVHEKEVQTVFTLGAITYVPHYKIKGKFVSPGYGKHHFNDFSAQELMDLGAKIGAAYLWSRVVKNEVTQNGN